jgi:hypothetical protein
MLRTIATARFNNDTYSQNKYYKELTNFSGSIYGSPVKMKEKMPLYIYVIEMNNSINKIEGIGLITNQISVDKYYRIYEERDYNRYIYKGSKHVSSEEITDKYSNDMIELLEQYCFKGKSHCKRGQGINELPKWIFLKENFVKIIDDIFKRKYNKETETILNE